MASVSLYFANALGALIWFIWLPAAAAVVVRALQRAWSSPDTPRAGAAVIAAMVALMAGLAAALAFSYSVDSMMLTSSGVWVFGGERSSEFWGLPSRGLYVLLDACLDMSPEGAAWLLRGFYLLTPWVFLAVIVGLPPNASGLGQTFTPTKRWTASLVRHWPAFALALIVFNPVMCVGNLNAWYVTPLPIAFGVLLVAAREMENEGGLWSLLALCTSLVLISLFRPESAPVATVMAFVLIWRLGRRRVGSLIALLFTAAVLAFLCVSAVWNLISSLQVDRFVFAEDTGHATSLLEAIPMLLGRMAGGLPGAIFAQFFVTGGLVGFAVVAAVRALRRRSADLPTLMSLTWLALELLILSVHEQGPGSQTLKYGLVLIAPASFLGLTELARLNSERHFVARFGLSAFLVVVVVIQTAIGFHPIEDFNSTGRFETETAFDVSEMVCSRDESQDVDVLCLDIHGRYHPTGYGDWSESEAELIFDPQGHDKPNTWMIEQLIHRDGCYIENTCRYGSDLSHMRGVLDISLEFDSLCGRSCEDGGPNPKWNSEFGVAVVTAIDGRWLAELEMLLAGPENCGWQPVSRLPNVMILVR